MFSTLEGAKKFAKNLKTLFDDSGIIFPLNRCQKAAAIAGGFRDWHDLSGSLAGADRPVDPGAFRRRLIAFLPQPCWIPVLFWLDEGNLETADGDGLSRNYYRAVVPYVFSSSVIHRSKSALLRPGSGPGQRLRESMVVSLLLGGKGDKRLIPQLEPDTLALVVSGDTASLFGDDARHPRFEKDLASLVAAGIFEYEDGILRILPADKDEVAAHAARGFTDRAQYFAGVGGDEAIEALSATGIEQATRVAEAVVGKGSETHITPSGPILEMLSKLGGWTTDCRFPGLARVFDDPSGERKLRARVRAGEDLVTLSRPQSRDRCRQDGRVDVDKIGMGGRGEGRPARSGALQEHRRRDRRRDRGGALDGGFCVALLKVTISAAIGYRRHASRATA